MKYIELPDGTTLKKDERKYHYFTYANKHFFLEDILKNEKMGVFTDKETGLSLSVLSRIPEKDKFYAEYLQNNGKPAQWCEVVNGKVKKNQNDHMNTIKSWVNTDGFFALTEGRQQAVMANRKQQKEDRYEKGPRSY